MYVIWISDDSCDLKSTLPLSKKQTENELITFRSVKLTRVYIRKIYKFLLCLPVLCLFDTKRGYFKKCQCIPAYMTGKKMDETLNEN